MVKTIVFSALILQLSGIAPLTKYMFSRWIFLVEFKNDIIFTIKQ